MTYTIETNIEMIGGVRGTDISALIASELKAGHSIFLPDSDPGSPWIFGDIALGNSDPTTNLNQIMLCNPKIRGAGKGRTFIEQLPTAGSMFVFNTLQWPGKQSIWPVVELHDMFLQGAGANKYGVTISNDANGILIGAELRDIIFSNFGAWSIILSNISNACIKNIEVINAAASGLVAGGVYATDCGDLHMDTVAIHACGGWGFVLEGSNKTDNHANEGVRLHKCSTNTGPGLAQLGCHIENYKFVHLTDNSFTSVTNANALEFINVAFSSVKGGDFQGTNQSSGIYIDSQSQQNRISGVEAFGSVFGIYCMGRDNLITENILSFNTYGDLAMQTATCTGNIVALNQMLSTSTVGIIESGGATKNEYSYNRIVSTQSIYDSNSIVRK